MTPEQWRRWDEDGYLILEGALSDSEVNDLTAEVDKLDAESQRLGRDPNTLLHAVNIIDRATEGLFQPDRAKSGRILRPEPSDTLLNLIDHPNHLGIVCDLIGPAILLSWAEAMVRPPNPKPSNRWHKDGSKPYYFPQVDGRTPLLWARIGFFLNDLASPDMGNFTVIPGSHRTGFPKIDQGRRSRTDDHFIRPIHPGRTYRRRSSRRPATDAQGRRRGDIPQRHLALCST